MNYEYYSTLKTFDVEIKGNNNPENKRWNFWEFFRVEAEDAQDAKEIVLKWEPSIQNLRWRTVMSVEEVQRDQ